MNTTTKKPGPLRRFSLTVADLLGDARRSTRPPAAPSPKAAPPRSNNVGNLLSIAHLTGIGSNPKKSTKPAPQASRPAPVAATPTPKPAAALTYADGARAWRARGAAVMASPAAARRTDLALRLLFETSLTAEQIIGTLEVSPVAQRPYAAAAAHRDPGNAGRARPMTPASVAAGWDAAFAKAAAERR